jgi:hypothetical protein
VRALKVYSDLIDRVMGAVVGAGMQSDRRARMTQIAEMLKDEG